MLGFTDDDDDKKNYGMLNKIGSFLGIPDLGTTFQGFAEGLQSYASSLIFGFLSSQPQQNAKQETIKQIDSAKSDIRHAIGELKLDAALADSLTASITKDCQQTTDETFGMMGLGDTKDAATKVILLQRKLTGEIDTALAQQYGKKYAAADRLKIASEAAASITGLDTDIALTDASGQADAQEVQMVAGVNKPTQGLGGMLLNQTSQVQHDPKQDPSRIEVPKFAIAQSALDAAKRDLH